jgi:hypothetical protein
VLDAATLTPQEYESAPAFEYEDEPVTTMLQRVAGPIVAMAIASVLLLWIGFRQYRGYAL